MLDRTDFASWQQRIRLYYRGKENGVNILKSIDEGPFQLGTFRETLAKGDEGAFHLGPEQPRVYSDLSPEEKERYNVDIRVTNILLQGLPKGIYTLINHYTDAKDIWDNVKMLLEEQRRNHSRLLCPVCQAHQRHAEHQDDHVQNAVNSKFVNNMLPEWGRFVMVVKLNREIQEYWDKEEKIKKAEEEAILNAISKTEVIKVVREEAKKIGIHPKEEISSKAVYRGIDGRNFDVHKPFLFGAFGISELDELREIIPKKKNTVVKDLMNSLSRRKRKHMELEPEIRIPGLECNRTLPENVSFVNNMVIEEHEYEIFFTDEFGDQAFQRWSDIDKVRMEALVSYPLAASMVKSPKNARFNMKPRKLIDEHPDQEKLKSKKLKLEALGYNMD
nr:integrase, catalytic region, zinc finger, CCHC-type, peptidase aspartic, catalytic [Tanacetum cinerariifolium]